MKTGKTWGDAFRESVASLLPALAIVASVAMWKCDRTATRAAEDYGLRAPRYSKLVAALDGFTVHHHSAEMKQAFLDELKQCWLYCSDEVIRSANAFLDVVKVGTSESKEDRALAVAALVLSVRQDLMRLRREPLGRTTLRVDEFQILAPTPPPESVR